MKIKIIVFILASKLSLVSAQSYRELVEEKEQLLKESSEINFLLKKTEASKSVTLEDLSLLNNEINVQKNILKIFDKEINVLAIEKKNIESELIQNTADLDFLEQSYSRLLRSSHIFSLKQSPIKFFLSSQSFNQLSRRIYHMRSVERSKRRLFDEIKEKKKEILNKKEEVTQKRSHQIKLKYKKNLELDKLSQSKTAKELMINNLTLKQDSLKKVLQQKNTRSDKISKEILLILEEQKNLEKLNPKFELVSQKFEENKGKLPWPVNRGSVVSNFGEVPHPVLKGISTINNGIEIATSESSVRSIFDGEVTKIIVMPNGQKVVIVRHGQYFSVYSNLQGLDVNSGDKLKTNETIGSLDDKKSVKRSVLGLQIWKGREKLNPRHWLGGY